MQNTRTVLSDAKFYESYSRWDDQHNRYETWDESVERVMKMHRSFFADKVEGDEELQLLMDYAESVYKNKGVLGAQRALQFGGDQLLDKHSRMYNCVSTHADRPAFFQAIMWWALCGAGVGFSVQKHHVAKLGAIHKRLKQPKTFVVEDSIEGWADACGVLISSYMEDGTFP